MGTRRPERLLGVIFLKWKGWAWPAHAPQEAAPLGLAGSLPLSSPSHLGAGSPCCGADDPDLPDVPLVGWQGRAWRAERHSVKAVLLAVTLCAWRVGSHACHLLGQSELRVTLHMSVLRGNK